jgi:hypothetical protein
MALLQAIRWTSGALFTVSLGVGLTITFDNEPNDAATYLLFYGVAAVLALAAIFSTVAIERRKRTTIPPAVGGDSYTVSSERQYGGTTAGRIQKGENGHDS